MILDLLDEFGTSRMLALSEPGSGLRAFVAIDDLTLGPAFGGTRTRSYSSEREAIEEVIGLAQSMTLKCAFAGLAAGGGKAVILDHPQLNRAAAFQAYGRFVEELGGIFRTSGDLGTSEFDLLEMKKTTRFVHTEERRLGQATAEGIARAIEACAETRGLDSLEGARISIQGCGAIGASTARVLVELGARIRLSDIDRGRVETLAEEVNGEIVDPEDILTAPCDILVPCARGGVIDEEVAARAGAWALCPGANRAIANEEAEQILFNRGILVVPDFISSAGAVIVGVAEMSEPQSDPAPFLEGIRARTKSVLEEAAETSTIPSRIAKAKALDRIEGARRSGR